MTHRKFIKPSFNETRHIINLAQVLSYDKISLMTFDGDQTLYEDGGNFTDLELAMRFVVFLKSGIKICIVTAANYGDCGEKYEFRLQGLLAFFRGIKLDPKVFVDNFFVLGGMCNFLLKLDENYRIVPVENWPGKVTVTEKMTKVMDRIEGEVRTAAREMNMKAQIIRKKGAVGLIVANNLQTPAHSAVHSDPRTKKYSNSTANGNSLLAGPGAKKLSVASAVGKKSSSLVPGSNEEEIMSSPNLGCFAQRSPYYFRQEQLDEIGLRNKHIMMRMSAEIDFPWCASNGGNEAWFDFGNKYMGIKKLQEKFGILPKHCIHIGDQLATTGNDYAARFTSPVGWIANPSETKKILKHIVKHLNLRTLEAENVKESVENLVEKTTGLCKQGSKFLLEKASNHATLIQKGIKHGLIPRSASCSVLGSADEEEDSSESPGSPSPKRRKMSDAHGVPDPISKTDSSTISAACGDSRSTLNNSIPLPGSVNMGENGGA